MIHPKLTGPFGNVTSTAMWGSARLSGGKAKAGLAMWGATLLTGCINVTAPEKPIVIELNINIRQEVIYRLAEDAANTIEENEDIF